MQVSCPSCAATYNTEDYPNAFEINCVCGYSILVPQNLNHSSTSKENKIAFDAAIPTAMDAEDEGLLIRPEGLMDLNPNSDEGGAKNAGGVLEMTPPDQLPPSMVYDPFELPPSQELDLGLKDAFAERPSQEPLDSRAQSPSEVASNTSRLPSNEVETPALPVAVERFEARAQILVTRAQMASIGNFLGNSFDLKLEDLSKEDAEQVLIRVTKLLADRPWLEAEIKKRNIELASLIDKMEIQNLPEILAMEIYLSTFELGGRCLLKITNL